MSQAEQTPSIDEIRAQVSRMLDRLDPKAPIAATVVFQVRPDREGVFRHNLEALATATRQLPGLKIFSYHQHTSIGAPGGGDPQYLIYEEWQSRDAFRAQWESAHLQHFQYSVGALVAAPPELNFYSGSDRLDWSASQARAQARALATGQKRCWDAEGRPISGTGTGMDGDVRAGVPFPSPRFTDHGNGTVTDERTGLVWLKNANAYGPVSWPQALGNAAALASGQHGLTDGSQAGDWRMPNINELQSLVDLDSDSGPALPKDHPFLNLQASNYWSSSTVAIAPALGWYTALAVAPPVFDLKMNAMRMWPVRGKGYGRVAQTGQTRCYDVWGQPISCQGTGQDGELRTGVPLPKPRFEDHHDGSVTDLLTGLVWLKNAHTFGTQSWGSAVELCHQLGHGQRGLTDGSRPGDWRLPNIHEMRSIIDYDNFAPALPAGHPFENVHSSLYWSSTTVASAPNQARFVFVGIGPSVWDHKSVLLGVWPVRNGRGSGGSSELAALAGAC